MLELLEAQDGVIAMRATGLLDAADIERGIAAVDEALNTPCVALDLRGGGHCRNDPPRSPEGHSIRDL